MRRTRGAVATGLLLAAAFLTKQNGLAEGVAVLTALAFGPRRRLAWPAALTYGAVLGISTLALGLTSRGWYVFYVFELLSEHPLKDAAFGQFWTVYLLPVLGLACCALVLGVRRTPLVLVRRRVPRWWSRATPRWSTAAARVNDLLPAYLAVALLAGLAMGGQPRRPGEFLRGPAGPRPGSRTGGPGWSGRWVAAAAAALVIAQLAVLVNGFRPGQAIPASADRAVGLRLASGMRALGGTIAVPSDPGLDLLAGLPLGSAPGRDGRRSCAPRTRRSSRASGAAPPARWRRDDSARS